MLESAAERVTGVLALVDVAEGFRMLVRMERCDPERIALGMPVRIVFAGGDDGLVLPRAAPH